MTDAPTPWWLVGFVFLGSVLAGGAAFYLDAFTTPPSSAAPSFLALATTGFGALLGILTAKIAPRLGRRSLPPPPPSSSPPR